MTSWAKNQIAKQLARFVKNLEPSQISLKFLKGEGELLNLELNEQVLSELLELPPWLQLRKALCNRICAKIHWTSLKTDPIRLFLDCVEVEIYASENVTQKPQATAHPHGKPSSKEKHQAPKASKYGFAEKVVDGMFVSINSVVVSFKASGFKASFSMSRFIVQSTDQHWIVPNNLRKTRIKDEQRGEVLIFKEIKWGTMRLDADAAYAEASEQGSIPIRLITNNSAIHLTIKKRLNDCSLVSSRLEVILDDILWILTQSQLLKLSSFVHYILRTRQKFLPMASHSETPKDHRPVANAQGQSRSSSQFQGQGYGTTLNKLFTEHDVVETSYHVKTSRIDLHLCDDQTLSGISSSAKKKQNSQSSDESGALLISIHKFRLDHYPYHIAGLKRKLERNDDDALFSRRQWAQQLFDFFLKNEGKQINHIAHMLSKASGGYRRPMMYESFFLISCTKFAIMQVSTNDRQEPQPFLSSDKESLFLPEDMNSFLLDFTSYYFIGYQNLPVPPSNMHLKLNPIKLTFHPLTCIWLNKFIQSVVAGFEWTKEFMTKETGPPEHLDMRIECLMPQVTLPCESDASLPHKEQRPKALQVQISQAVVSNSRIGTATSQSDLLMDVQNALASKVYVKSNDFPNSAVDCGPLPNDYWVNDYSIIHSRFMSAYRRDRASSFEQSQMDIGVDDARPERSKTHSKETTVPRIIWCLWCEQIWIDFIGVEKSYGRPVTLIDAVPIRLWLSFPVIVQKPIPIRVENGIAANIKTEADANGPDSNEAKRDAPNETVRRPLIKTGSTNSLPASLKSSAIISSPSNASSSSSVSIESTTSNQDNLSGLEQTIHYHRSANRLHVNQVGSMTSADEFHQTPLRTSYSETDLVPDFTSEASSNQGSLQNIQTQDLILGEAGPPPPYSISQSNGTKNEQNQQIGSTESLPPTYSQLPSYHALEAENEMQAPPLPSKMPNEVVDYFVANKNDKHEALDAVKMKLPTIGSILQVTKETNIQLDHFQLVFLLRLQEMFADVASKILADTMHFQTLESPVHKEVAEANCFSLHLSIPSVDVNIILPPLEFVPNEQILSLEDRIASGKLTRFIELLQPKNKTESHDNDSNNSKDNVGMLNGQELRNTSSDTDSGAVSQSETSCSSSDKSNLNSPEKVLNQIKIPPLSDDIFDKNAKECKSSKDGMDKKDLELQVSYTKSIVNEVAVHESTTSAKTDDVCRDNNDVSVEKTEIENEVISFDVPDKPADHVMITDESSDEGEGEERDNDDNESNLLDVRESESRLRSALRVIETSETGTQTESEVCEDAGYETYRDEAVSVVCLKCKNVRVAVQSEDPNLLLKVIVDEIVLKEQGNITYGMTLDHRLSVDKKKEKEELLVSDSKPQIMVRLTSGPAAKELGDDAAELGFAHVKVRDLNTKLHLSNAENLSEFVEDEYLIKKMPFKVELENLQLALMDNKPRRYLSAPLPPPMEIRILQLLVSGASNGRIMLANNSFNGLENIEALDNGIKSVEETQNRKKNDEAVEENERLVDDLKLASARLVSLEQERDAILKVVEKLQQELMWSNHENEKLLEKMNNYKIYIKNLNRK